MQATPQAGDVAAMVVVGHPIIALITPDHGRVDLCEVGVRRRREAEESVRRSNRRLS
jgi:hypothetical protein